MTHSIAPPANGYRGRFAPSPTGPLHFGSLLAALASYLDARHHGGEWLVRMEDLDPPREVPGARKKILTVVEALGLEWDGEVLYQNARQVLYESYLNRLRQLDLVYYCTCSRTRLTEGPRGPEGYVYDGLCRGRPPTGKPGAWRVRVGRGTESVTDRIQGPVSRDLEREGGDFVLRRRDGLFAYQLAVVVDDALQGITHVVRGSDLLGVTVRQTLLQRLLGFPQPGYAHHPVAVGPQGDKLSKQTGAPPLRFNRLPDEMYEALRFLGQSPPPELKGADCRELLAWAVPHWQLARIPQVMALPAPDHCYDG